MAFISDPKEISFLLLSIYFWNPNLLQGQFHPRMFALKLFDEGKGVAIKSHIAGGPSRECFLFFEGCLLVAYVLDYLLFGEALDYTDEKWDLGLSTHLLEGYSLELG